jgi:hypothetical protein
MGKFYLNIDRDNIPCCRHGHSTISGVAQCQSKNDVDIAESYNGDDISPFYSDRKLVVSINGELFNPDDDELRLFELIRFDSKMRIASEIRERECFANR